MYIDLVPATSENSLMSPVILVVDSLEFFMRTVHVAVNRTFLLLSFLICLYFICNASLNDQNIQDHAY